MSVFQVFKIAQMVPNRAKHLIYQWFNGEEINHTMLLINEV